MHVEKLNHCWGSVTFWYGSGCGSAPKHTDPTDLDADSEHWYIYTTLQRKNS